MLWASPLEAHWRRLSPTPPLHAALPRSVSPLGAGVLRSTSSPEYARTCFAYIGGLKANEYPSADALERACSRSTSLVVDVIPVGGCGFGAIINVQTELGQSAANASIYTGLVLMNITV